MQKKVLGFALLALGAVALILADVHFLQSISESGKASIIPQESSDGIKMVLYAIMGLACIVAGARMIRRIKSY